MKDVAISKEKEKQKALYIATLIHDLKTPLQAQLSSLNLLRNGNFGKINKTQEQIIDIIIESSTFMQDMLLNVLNTYKIENGTIKFNIEICNLDELIKICINEINNFAMTYNIEIEYINTVQDSNIQADIKLIRRVIANMLNNGINYGYKNTKLLINLNEDKAKIYIKIKNKGYKIPDEIKEHIFDKYFSTENLSRRTGAGLGLYYCKKVIEAHNGNIYLNSNENNNEFIIELNKSSDTAVNKNFTFI